MRIANKVQHGHISEKEQAFQTIALVCLEEILYHESGLFQAYEEECIHQLRVNLRRLRTAMQIFKEVISVPSAFEDEIAWISHEIAPARDWDVLISSTLVKIADSKEKKVSTDKVMEQSSRQAEKNHLAAIDALSTDRFSHFILNLSLWLHTQGWKDAFAVNENPSCKGEVKQFYRRASKRVFRRIFDLGNRLKKNDVKKLHRLRITVKKAHYLIEFSSSYISPARKKDICREVTKLQDGLGNINDMVVADRLLEHIRQSTQEISFDIDSVKNYLDDLRTKGLKKLHRDLRRHPLLTRKHIKFS